MARSYNRSTRKSILQWQALVADCARSGLSAIAFCNQRRLSYVSFIHWRVKLKRQESAEALPDAKSPFVEISPSSSVHPLPEQKTTAWDVELILGAGMVLRLRCAS